MLSLFQRSRFNRLPIFGVYDGLWTIERNFHNIVDQAHQSQWSRRVLKTIFEALSLAERWRAPPWQLQIENPSKEFRSRLQENSLLICPWGEKGAFASDEKNIYKRSVLKKLGLLILGSDPGQWFYKIKTSISVLHFHQQRSLILLELATHLLDQQFTCSIKENHLKGNGFVLISKELTSKTAAPRPL